MGTNQHDGTADPGIALATWIYLLHTSGLTAADEAIEARCADIDGAQDSDTGDAAGEALVALVTGRLGDRSQPEAVAQVAHALFGAAVATDLGQGTREERLARIRRYQFDRSLPWLARIIERHADGHIGPTWLLVERVTDEVLAMDPNPWDGIDEDRILPLADFQVLWELDECTAIHLA